STCDSITGCSRPSAETPCSSVRGCSTVSAGTCSTTAPWSPGAPPTRSALLSPSAGPRSRAGRFAPGPPLWPAPRRGRRWPTEPAATHDLDALRSGADRGGERALHRAPEADPVLELLRDRLCDELRVELGPLDLVDVDVDGLARHPVDVLAQRVDLDARLADHDPGPGRVDVDRDPLRVLADQNVRQACVRELLVDVLADTDVLLEEVREVLAARVPVRLPVVDDAYAHPA